KKNDSLSEILGDLNKTKSKYDVERSISIFLESIDKSYQAETYQSENTELKNGLGKLKDTLAEKKYLDHNDSETYSTLYLNYLSLTVKIRADNGKLVTDLNQSLQNVNSSITRENNYLANIPSMPVVTTNAKYEGI